MNSISRVLVCGLGRCGTSLMMQMLAGGGMPTVGKFPGYEHARTAPGRVSRPWLEAQSGAIKLLDTHRHQPELLELPNTAIIWMERDFDQQALSQAKFLHQVAEQPKPNRRAVRALASTIRTDTEKMRRFLARTSTPSLTVSFEDLVTDPEWTSVAITRFLMPSFALNPPRMARQVFDRGARPAECLKYMLEVTLVAGALAE